VTPCSASRSQRPRRREALDGHDRRARARGGVEDDVESEDVEERQHAEQHVVGVQRQSGKVAEGVEVGQRLPCESIAPFGCPVVPEV
jgi:hypothetical protein